MNDEDNKKLKELNEAVDLACKNRRDFLDSKMNEYAKVKIGEDMYHLGTGVILGCVESYYRYHAEDIRFDNKLSIQYRFKNGDNTSSQRVHSFHMGTKEDLVKQKKIELDNLLNG